MTLAEICLCLCKILWWTYHFLHFDLSHYIKVQRQWLACVSSTSYGIINFTLCDCISPSTPPSHIHTIFSKGWWQNFVERAVISVVTASRGSSEPATFVQRLPTVFHIGYSRTFRTHWVVVVQAALVHWGVTKGIVIAIGIADFWMTSTNKFFQQKFEVFSNK